MPFLSCKNLRISVIAAAVLIVTGFLLQVPSLLFVSEAIFSSVILSFLGLVIIFTGMLLLLVTGIVSLIPSVSKHLQACQH